MELATIGMTRDDARQEVERYRRARQTIALTREDERMLTAYRAIARGKTVIDLHRAIELGGLERSIVTIGQKNHTVDMPRLAALRADKRWAFCDGVGTDGTVTFRDTHAKRPGASNQVGDRAAIGEIRLQIVEAFGRDDSRQQVGGWWRQPTFRALIPPVPAPLRPVGALSGYTILFEAEWQLDRTVPPGDPALLKRLGGTLYQVVSTWDLTPVEQAVLAGRRPTAREIDARA